MPKYPKNYKDIEYYAPGRKKRIAGSTKATFDFLECLHEENRMLTIAQLREMITDPSMYIYEPEAVEVLDAYIKTGYGDYVPEWRLRAMCHSR